MNNQDTLNTITSKFKTDIADAHSIPVQYDNDGTPRTDDVKYIALSVLFGNARLVTMTVGSRRWRTVGVMEAIIYVPATYGLKDAMIVADWIVDAFRGVRSGGVNYKTPYISNIGQPDQEGDMFYQVNVSTDFWVDDLE